MPSTAPRSNTTKKENQLRQKQQELEHAICNEMPRGKLTEAAERLRTVQLSLLKARLHWIAECGIRRSDTLQVPTRE